MSRSFTRLQFEAEFGRRFGRYRILAPEILKVLIGGQASDFGLVDVQFTAQMVGFMLDGSISGYKLIDHKETPGLGTKVADEAFAGQFKGLNPDKVDFRVKKDGGDIDAVTAATISSRAVIDAIQRAYDAYTTFSAGI